MEVAVLIMEICKHNTTSKLCIDEHSLSHIHEVAVSSIVFPKGK